MSDSPPFDTAPADPVIVALDAAAPPQDVPAGRPKRGRATKAAAPQPRPDDAREGAREGGPDDDAPDEGMGGEPGGTGGGFADGHPLDPAAPMELAALDPTDTDNGRRLIRHFGEDLLVQRRQGAREVPWVVWDGCHWDATNGREAAERRVQLLGDRIKLEVAHIGPTEAEAEAIRAGARAEKVPEASRTEADKAAIDRATQAKVAVTKRKAARWKFGVSSKNRDRCRNALAQAAPHLLRDPDDFDADPLVVATPSATLRFTRRIDPECPDPEVTRYTAAVEATPGHRREDLITRLLPHDWRPGAARPKWDAFITWAQPDPEQRRAVQRAAGLGLLGLTEQKLVFHYGEGANGKSVFLEVVSQVLGPLAVSLPSESISGENQRGGAQASPDIARLHGARFVRVAEIKEGAPLEEELVKKLTGGEKFPVRNLFEGFFEFQPRFIAHMSGNGYPRIAGTDNGIWRRMFVVRWPQTLAPGAQRNFADVVGELTAEAEGVLDWLVEGALDYLRHGLPPTAAIAAETQAYRDEMDPVRRFFEPSTEPGDEPYVEVTGLDDDMVPGGLLYRAYEQWAADCGLRPVSGTRFGRDAPKIKGVRRVDGARRMYRGVKLLRRPAARETSDEGRWGRDE